MKPYTVRYAHLETLPEYLLGDIVNQGDKIGRMGTTGQSKHNHLHIDVVHGYITKILRLNQIGYEPQDVYKPSIKQLNFFIDKGLFKAKPVITTHFYDPEYKELFGKDHPAYDLVPEDRHSTDKHFDIFWNRRKEGVILAKDFDGGYGNYVLIGFEA